MAGLVNILKLVHKMSDLCNFILMYLIIHTVIYIYFIDVNQLTPNDPHMGRTAKLTSRRCILYIYSTNIHNEYFKHAE